MTQIQYKNVESRDIERLKGIVGDNNVITGRESLIDYSHDEFALEDIRHFPDVVVKPRNTEEVSTVVGLCNEERIPLTPRGGGTGLCGGCVPTHGGIVLILDNMTRIIEIDTRNLQAQVEAGLRLMDFYSAVEGNGLFFPPHPGDESAAIGGVIATNAGGARAVKYGVIRNFIRGIEVVLPSGEVVKLGGKFLKNSSGYNLMHLVIGSEGTLGIVTQAIIGLMPPPKTMYTLVALYHHLQDAINTVPAIIRNGIIPMAIEFMDRKTVTISSQHLQKKWPFSRGDAYLMMIVDGNNFEEVAALGEKINEVCSENNAIEVLAADTRARQRDILDIRSNIYEAMKMHTLEILDLTVPRGQIADFVDEIQGLSDEYGTWLPTYGHAADGNVHTHIMRSIWNEGEWTEIEDCRKLYPVVRKRLHDLGRKYEGICSGEHGIGIVKKEYLESFLDAKQIDLMRAIKKAFDPNLILNPDKIFNL